MSLTVPKIQAQNWIHQKIFTNIYGWPFDHFLGKAKKISGLTSYFAIMAKLYWFGKTRLAQTLIFLPAHKTLSQSIVFNENSTLLFPTVASCKILHRNWFTSSGHMNINCTVLKNGFLKARSKVIIYSQSDLILSWPSGNVKMQYGPLTGEVEAKCQRSNTKRPQLSNYFIHKVANF